MIDEQLVNPTVGDVRRLLEQCPDDMPFRIEDADTNWTISVIDAETRNGILWFSGQYATMEGSSWDYRV